VDVSGADNPGLLTIVDFESGLFYESREHLRYRTEGGRLRNVLGRRVPVIGARAVTEVAGRLLERHALSTKDIGWWAVHTGGTSVLDQVRETLELGQDALRFAYEVFGEYGNMSSPSVMFVLQKILDEGRPAAGDLGLLLSFGAGFTAFAALVRF
jgi:predicted naringenin-chalcone synthase